MEDLPLDLIPPSWLAAAHEWAPWALGALVLATIAVRLLLPLARAVERWAITTPAAWDDGPARRVVVALEWAAGASAAILALIPRLTIGDPRRRAQDAPFPGRAPTDTLLALGLAIVVGAGALTSGCGGVPREARTALEGAADGFVLADDFLAERIETRGELARLQVRAEVREGRIAAPTVDEIVALGLERLEEILAPETLARTTLRASRSGLLSAERILDSWAAGARGEGALFGAAACALAALTDAGDAVSAAGVDVPDELTSAIAFLAPLARGACPDPQPEGGV